MSSWGTRTVRLPAGVLLVDANLGVVGDEFWVVVKGRPEAVAAIVAAWSECEIGSEYIDIGDKMNRLPRRPRA